MLSNLLGLGIQNCDYWNFRREFQKFLEAASTHFITTTMVKLREDYHCHQNFFQKTHLKFLRLFEILNTSSFEDDKRVKELMFQTLWVFNSRLLRMDIDSATAASATHNKLAQIHEISGGLSSLFQFAPFISNNDEATKKQIEQITNLIRELKNNANELAFVSNVKLSKEQLSKLKELSFKKDGDSNIAFDFKKEFSRIAMPINTQVNFSAMSMDAPLYDPKDSAKYLVLSSILRNEFLHRKVREQGGAYGGGAIYDPFAGSFKLFSYRDPRF